MRVLWILCAQLVSGAETSLGRVLPLLRRQGIRPEVAVPSRSPISRAMAAKGCRVHLLSRVPWGRFDVIHTHSHVFEGAMVAREFGIPHVWHVRDHQLLFRKPRGKVTSVDQIRLMAMLSDAILVCSKSLKDELARCGVRGAQVLHHGIPVQVPAASLEGRRIACVANFFPWKGQLDLIRAMWGLRDAELVLAGGVGDAVYARRCRVAAKGLPVRFVGYLKDVTPLLRSASVLAVPSQEALSMAALEGMALGLPVVSLDRGGIRDVVVQGKTGFLVPANRMGTPLRRLLDDPALRRRMGKAGRERVRKYFRPEDVARALVGVYRRVTA